MLFQDVCVDSHVSTGLLSPRWASLIAIVCDRHLCVRGSFCSNHDDTVCCTSDSSEIRPVISRENRAAGGRDVLQITLHYASQAAAPSKATSGPTSSLREKLGGGTVLG